jgi:hypothetical protein
MTSLTDGGILHSMPLLMPSGFAKHLHQRCFEVVVEVIPADAHTISQMLGADDDQPQADL